MIESSSHSKSYYCTVQYSARSGEIPCPSRLSETWLGWDSNFFSSGGRLRLFTPFIGYFRATRAVRAGIGAIEQPFVHTLDVVVMQAGKLADFGYLVHGTTRDLTRWFE